MQCLSGHGKFGFALSRYGEGEVCKICLQAGAAAFILPADLQQIFFRAGNADLCLGMECLAGIAQAQQLHLIRPGTEKVMNGYIQLAGLAETEAEETLPEQETLADVSPLEMDKLLQEETL